MRHGLAQLGDTGRPLCPTDLLGHVHVPGRFSPYRSVIDHAPTAAPEAMRPPTTVTDNTDCPRVSQTLIRPDRNPTIPGSSPPCPGPSCSKTYPTATASTSATVSAATQGSVDRLRERVPIRIAYMLRACVVTMSHRTAPLNEAYSYQEPPEAPWRGTRHACRAPRWRYQSLIRQAPPGSPSCLVTLAYGAGRRRGRQGLSGTGACDRVCYSGLVATDRRTAHNASCLAGSGFDTGA